MATATIVSVNKDANNAYATARVAEGGALGNVEYSGSTPLLKADGSAKTTAELKTDLTASLKAQRDAQLAVITPVAGISGTVTI